MQVESSHKIKLFDKNSATKNSIIPTIQGYFATQPITKAWLFGSYSRGEETIGSDVDILVTFDEDAKISLFKYADIICQLENLLKRNADLVEECTLLPFAQKTANDDKVLIYERESVKNKGRLEHIFDAKFYQVTP